MLIEENEILRKLSNGEKDMFKHVFNKYYKDLCSFVYIRFIKDVDESEEIVQNIFVKLWENKEKLITIDSLNSYLYKSAYNACLNYIKHQKVINKYKNEASFQLKQFEFSIMEDQVENDKIDDISTAINDLPKQTKRIFILKYTEGLKYKEIAKELNISNKTVETLIYRGLKQLRSKLIPIHMFSILIIRFLVKLIY